MRGSILAAAIAMLVVSSRRADACHTGYEIGQAVIGGGALLIDTGLAIHDVVVDRSSRGYAIAEIALTAPQVPIAIAFLHERAQPCEEAPGTIGDQTSGVDLSVPLLVVSSTLLAHGIYVLVRPRSSPAAPGARYAIVPMIGAEQREGLGLAIAGTF